MSHWKKKISGLSYVYFTTVFVANFFSHKLTHWHFDDRLRQVLQESTKSLLKMSWRSTCNITASDDFRWWLNQFIWKTYPQIDSISPGFGLKMTNIFVFEATSYTSNLFRWQKLESKLSENQIGCIVKNMIENGRISYMRAIQKKFDLAPHPVTVTSRIITFWVGTPYKL